MRPEVLAPAGDVPAMMAAVAAGADAVYFGLKGHNARARADNFDEHNLQETVSMLHRHGVKAYITLNTLVFNHELSDVAAKLRACANAGVDAIIVQDLGVVALAQQLVPTLPVHASTQMTCTDADSADFAASLGVKRVVVARELSVDDIRAIRAQTDVELEVFVHGALCISYSGQCLTSEAIGGRSANRGACAQACRLPYQLEVDGVVRDLGDQAYLLSPQDLDGHDVVADLAQLGVSSLKIEGRLKAPEYVASATAMYRARVDHDDLDPAMERRAQLSFSRGGGAGFLRGTNHQQLVDGETCDHRGVWLGVINAVESRGRDTWLRFEPSTEGAALWLARRNDAPTKGGNGLGVLVQGRGDASEHGGRIWSSDEDAFWMGPHGGPHHDDDPRLWVGRRVFVTDDPDSDAHIRHTLHDAPVRERLHLHIHAIIGEPMRIEAHSQRGLVATTTTDDELTAARAHAVDVQLLRDELGRLGDTPYQLGELTLHAPLPVFVAKSVLSKLRRKLVDGLAAHAVRSHAITTTDADAMITATTASLPTVAPPGGLFVLCRNEAQAEAAIEAGADGVYLDFLALTGLTGAVERLRRHGRLIGVAPPRIRKPGEDKIDRFLATLQPDVVLVRSLGMLHSLSGDGPMASLRGRTSFIGDFSLNCSNTITAATLLSRGLSIVTPSYDLDADQLLGLLNTRLAAHTEVVVHQPMPLFHMEHCVFAATLSTGTDFRTCGRPCDRHSLALRDRAGIAHPVEADVGCRNTVFHAQPQSGAHLVGRLQTAGVARFRMELVRESAADVARLVSLMKSTLAGAHEPSAYKALKLDSGYGVVRGALRVLS
jgi:U32 family peptidase